MTDHQRFREALNNLLRSEYDCAGRLNLTLDAEAQALASRNLDAMERIIEEKMHLVRELETLDSNLQQLVRDTGFGGRPHDIEACLKWCDDDGALLRGWHLVLRRVRAAQQRNRANGAIMESSRRHAQQAVALLRGETTGAEVYGPAGATAPTLPGGRPLATA